MRARSEDLILTEVMMVAIILVLSAATALLLSRSGGTASHGVCRATVQAADLAAKAV